MSFPQHEPFGATASPGGFYFSNVQQAKYSRSDKGDEPMSQTDDKRIEVVTMKVKDLRTDFGNPRKIRKKKRDELRESLDNHGDFGLILIDENNRIIAGNQRCSVLKDKDPETEVLCKRLIGYTESELRVINLKDNTHSGEWDLDLLADWQADLTVDFGIDPKAYNVQDRKISNMELIRYEKYDYVMIVCRNEVDYLNLLRKLGLEDKRVIVAKQRKIKARAIWYDSIADQIKGMEKEE